MSQKKPAKKQNTSLISLIVVLVVALILIVVLFARSNNLNAQVDTLNNALTETNADLQETIASKEAVEEQLTLAETSLKEAQATLEESTRKVADLEGQLATLTAENTANKEQIALLTADLETAKANKAAAEIYLANVANSVEMALNALNGVTPAPAATEAPAAELPAEESADNTATETDIELVPEVTEAPAVEETAAPEVTEEPAVEETAAPEVTEEPAVEETAAPEVTEEPAVEETAAPEVTEEPAVEETAAPEVTEEPAVEETAAPEVTEEPAVEETAAPEVTEEPAVEETAAPEVTLAPEVTEEEPIAEPLVAVNDDGSFTVVKEPLTVTVTLDPTMVITRLNVERDPSFETEDANDVTPILAQFIGKSLPLNAADFTLDEDGLCQAVIDLLNSASFPMPLEEIPTTDELPYEYDAEEVPAA